MTTADNISTFISWAEQRIAKEYETNERLQKECDELSEPIELCEGTYCLTEEDRHDTIHEIEYFIKNGYPIKHACYECGVHITTYYRWKRNIKNGLPIGTASN